MQQFLLAHTTGIEPQALVDACLEQIGEIPADANLGFVYATDALARSLGSILDRLKAVTGIRHWVGTVGVAINCTGHEYYDEPALAVMIAGFPSDAFRILPNQTADPSAYAQSQEAWLRSHDSHLAVVHGDPTNADTPELMEGIATKIPEAFLTGGITSSQSDQAQVADELVHGGVSGVVFADTVHAAVDHTQGCTPIGPPHRITYSRRNIVAELDDRPALEVFKEEIGEVLAKDLRRVGGYIFAALPIPESDTGDYMVRNLVGIDTGQEMLAIGDQLHQGGQMMFCRRDGNTAREDMLRMLERLRSRTGEQQPRGGLYFSCLGRGRHQFGEGSVELNMIRDALGDFPLVGFFANGEIFRNRLYGYTGVLTLFL